MAAFSKLRLDLQDCKGTFAFQSLVSRRLQLCFKLNSS